MRDLLEARDCRMNYYNENDPFAAGWLRNLIAAKLIPQGVVDDRSILDVKPNDLKSYTQCHFFAGIGGWSLALSLAAWPVDRSVWTGSCPCQPFSAAGQGGGFADERHLWSYWFHLIEQCEPEQIFGEQVASKAGLDWLDLVRSDLEGAAYSVAAADLCAAGVGAPHIRQRLWFVADTNGLEEGTNIEALLPRQSESGGGSRLGHTVERDSDEHTLLWQGSQDSIEVAGRSLVSPWRDLEWLPCTDGKARPTQPGLFPLAHGVPGRVGKLRAAGNAIVPQVAAEFIKSYMVQRCSEVPD